MEALKKRISALEKQLADGRWRVSAVLQLTTQRDALLTTNAHLSDRLRRLEGGV